MWYFCLLFFHGLTSHRCLSPYHTTHSHRQLSNWTRLMFGLTICAFLLAAMNWITFMAESIFYIKGCLFTADRCTQTLIITFGGSEVSFWSMQLLVRLSPPPPTPLTSHSYIASHSGCYHPLEDVDPLYRLQQVAYGPTNVALPWAVRYVLLRAFSCQ